MTRCRIIAIALFATALAGCGSVKAPVDPPEAAHIKKVYALSNDYKQVYHKAPPNLDALKTWATKEGLAQEDAFVSPRDHMPYVLVAAPAPINLVVVHEKTNQDGKRYVVNVGGAAAQLTDDEVKVETERIPRNLPGLSKYRSK